MSSIHEIFLSLQGAWTFSREIFHAASGDLIGTALGNAVFSDSADSTMNFREEGEMSLPDLGRHEFFRHYTYALQDDVMQVFYGDGPQTGQLYQEYRHQENSLVQLATHICGADRYDGAYVFDGRDRFSLTTRIAGPHKDYVIVTEFTRK